VEKLTKLAVVWIDSGYCGENFAQAVTQTCASKYGWKLSNVNLKDVKFCQNGGLYNVLPTLPELLRAGKRQCPAHFWLVKSISPS
jgi:hypothetical protein